ncbi:MAG: hypothetical protein H7176_02385 [Bdellovibrionales bacterium]|nr:hypothetical protein [Massilia sp.]
MLKHIYDKTDKGREELATRKYHVTAKLRALLVMLDGHRPLDVLMKNFGPLGLSQDNVSELLADEFIALIDGGEPEAAPEEAVHKSAPVSARARMVARRVASAHAHHEHEHEREREHGEPDAGHEVGPEVHPSPGQAAAAGISLAEQFIAVREFYTQTIKSTLGLRGMLLQHKVEKCSAMEDLRELREVYLEAVLKAKGREMALSLSGRLDQLLGHEHAAQA